MADITHPPLRVLLADEQEEVIADLTRLSRALGHDVVARSTDRARTTELVTRHRPDVALVGVHHTEDHALDLIEQLNDVAPCPVVLILEEESPELVAAALDHGLDAFVARPTPEQLQNAITLARKRRAELEQAGRRVEELEAGRERLATIERAKGVLMERHDLDEQEAYARLRDEARRARTRIVDVAEAVLVSRRLAARPEAPPEAG